jgi:cytochrome P450
VQSPVRVPDLTDPATFAESVPHEAFDAIREMNGLYWQPARFGTEHGGFWAVTRMADIQEIEKNPEVFTSTRGAAFPGTNLPPDHRGSDGLMFMDPPRHSRVRRTASKCFSGRVVTNFETWVREIVDETLDRVSTLPRFDFVTEVAAVIPAQVIARVMGVPREDWGLIIGWTARSFAAQQLQDETRERVEGEVHGAITQYITEVLVPDRRAHPDDDASSVLLRGVDNGDVSESEALHFLRLLIIAGFETTHTLIGQSMRMMLESAEVRRKTDEAIVALGPDPVINEYLRLITPAMNMARTATRDTEIGGQQVRTGDVMQMYFVAANRDPAVFTERHTFDPWRAENRNLAFGSGAHRCLGSALAMLELRVLLQQLSARRLDLRLDGEPKRGWSVFINQLTSLPVAQA